MYLVIYKTLVNGDNLLLTPLIVYDSLVNMLCKYCVTLKEFKS